MQVGEYLCVKGLSVGRELEGKIQVYGAKNSALKVLASSLLFEGELIIQNVPMLKDVYSMLDILENLGVDTVLRCKDFKIKSKQRAGIQAVRQGKKYSRIRCVYRPYSCASRESYFSFPRGR